MHRATSLFIACAGMFLLALAYHFGATTAQGQAGDQLVAIGKRGADTYAYAVTLQGAIYAQTHHCEPWQLVGHMPPGCTPVNVLDPFPGGALEIACSDGSVWSVEGNVPSISLVHCSDIFGSPTPAAHQTFGQLKATYWK